MTTLESISKVRGGLRSLLASENLASVLGQHFGMGALKSSGDGKHLLEELQTHATKALSDVDKLAAQASALRPSDTVLRTRDVIAGLRQETEQLRDRAGKALEQRFELCKEANAFAARTDLRLEPNECSRLHLIEEAADCFKALDGADPGAIYEAKIMGAAPFVVRHDWGSLVDRSGDAAGGDIMLPAEVCAFEFKISGRYVTAFACAAGDGTLTLAQGCIFIQCADGYWVSPANNDSPLGYLVGANVDAICIAMDAGVASHEVVRAPDALNRKRAAKGKPPLVSYSIVDLSKRRDRAVPPIGGYAVGTGSKKRLHFCRGHWRHLSGGRRTWIRWCLKGDPDLGAVAKEYRL